MKGTANIAEPLRKVMEEHGDTNYSLAKALDLSQSTIANWLNGKPARVKMVRKLQEHYGTNLTEVDS